MTLGAAEAAQILLATAESGGTAAVAVLVGGAPEGAEGSRLAVVLRAAGVATEVHGGLGSAELDTAARDLLTRAIGDPRASHGLEEIDLPGVRAEIYYELRRPVQELIIVGAGHIALPMARTGAMLGFRVTVLDDRPEFATRERFPEAQRVVRVDFSDPFADVPVGARSHLILVTRGHKYDYECLVRALRADPPPAYIGMIGSRRRVRATFVQLVEEGVSTELIDRIHAPVGLDVGAETPEEIAVSVAAELVLLRRGGTGVPLKNVERIAERFFTSKAKREDE